jgi:hypothetical protein
MKQKMEFKMKILLKYRMAFIFSAIFSIISTSNAAREKETDYLREKINEFGSAEFIQDDRNKATLMSGGFDIPTMANATRIDDLRQEDMEDDILNPPEPDFSLNDLTEGARLADFAYIKGFDVNGQSKFLIVAEDPRNITEITWSLPDLKSVYFRKGISEDIDTLENLENINLDPTFIGALQTLQLPPNLPRLQTIDLRRSGLTKELFEAQNPNLRIPQNTEILF